MCNLLLQRDDVVRIENGMSQHVVQNVFANGEMADIAEITRRALSIPTRSRTRRPARARRAPCPRKRDRPMTLTADPMALAFVDPRPPSGPTSSPCSRRHERIAHRQPR